MSWNNITNVLTNVLKESDVKNVDNVLSKWNNHKDEIQKCLKAPASKKKGSENGDLVPPKKANTAYIFFSTEYLRANPGKKMLDVSKVWATMSESDKEKYNQLAVKDKQRYATDMAKWTEEHPESEVKPKPRAKAGAKTSAKASAKTETKSRAKPSAETGKASAKATTDEPKKKSSWNTFCALQRPLLKAEFPSAKLTDINQKLSAMWASFSDDKKKSFVDSTPAPVSKAVSATASVVAPNIVSLAKRVETKESKSDGFTRFCIDMKNIKEIKNLPEKKRDSELMNRWNTLSQKKRQDYERDTYNVEEDEEDDYSDESESELEDESDDE